MKNTIVTYAKQRFAEGATALQLVDEIHEKFPGKIGGYGYLQNLQREHEQGKKVAHHVSALYCPDGRRYEWTTDCARGAELLARMLVDRAREAGGEWVDVETAQS